MLPLLLTLVRLQSLSLSLQTEQNLTDFHVRVALYLKVVPLVVSLSLSLFREPDRSPSKGQRGRQIRARLTTHQNTGRPLRATQVDDDFMRPWGDLFLRGRKWSECMFAFGARGRNELAAAVVAAPNASRRPIDGSIGRFKQREKDEAYRRLITCAGNTINLISPHSLTLNFKLELRKAMKPTGIFDPSQETNKRR